MTSARVRAIAFFSCRSVCFQFRLFGWGFSCASGELVADDTLASATFAFLYNSFVWLWLFVLLWTFALLRLHVALRFRCLAFVVVVDFVVVVYCWCGFHYDVCRFTSVNLNAGCPTHSSCGCYCCCCCFFWWMLLLFSKRASLSFRAPVQSNFRRLSEWVWWYINRITSVGLISQHLVSTQQRLWAPVVFILLDIEICFIPIPKVVLLVFFFSFVFYFFSKK